jgi:hypothetical protein
MRVPAKIGAVNIPVNSDANSTVNSNDNSTVNSTVNSPVNSTVDRPVNSPVNSTLNSTFNSAVLRVLTSVRFLSLIDNKHFLNISLFQYPSTKNFHLASQQKFTKIACIGYFLCYEVAFVATFHVQHINSSFFLQFYVVDEELHLFLSTSQLRVSEK